MQMVVDMVYQRLPGWVRVVVSINTFRRIAKDFYDEAKHFIELHAEVPAKPTPEAKPSA